MLTRSLLCRAWILLCVCMLLCASLACADPLRAEQQQGAFHAFLLVRDANGKVIGTGDEVNMRRGATWRSRLTLHFDDGSVDDETAVYMQHTTVRLLSDHHVQKGPSFPQAMDMTIDAAHGTATWHEVKDGKATVHTVSVKLPADTCNGLLPVVMQNLPKGEIERKMGFVASMPKPRVVTLAIHPSGHDSFRLGGGTREALKYRVHIELGGLARIVAPVIGKEPPDIYLWVAQGEVPTFLRLEGPLFQDGPIWSIELSSPTWSARTAH